MDNQAFSQLVSKKAEEGKFDLRKSIKADKASRKQQKKNLRKRQEAAVAEHGSSSELGKSKAAKSAGYRDRAKERRQGTNPDYKGITEVAETISAEYTKFLGGDEEHTHLVKGLDTALLQKVRLQKGGDSSASTKGDGKSDPAVTTTSSLVETKRQVKFRSFFGRAVHRVVFAPPLHRDVDLYLPGRTTFEFQLLDAASGVDPAEGKGHLAEVPTLVTRSKDDVGEREAVLRGALSANILNMIAEFDLSEAASRRRKRRRKRNRRSKDGVDDANLLAKLPSARVEPTAAEPQTDNGDIFIGVGTNYVYHPKEKAAPKATVDQNELMQPSRVQSTAAMPSTQPTGDNLTATPSPAIISALGTDTAGPARPPSDYNFAIHAYPEAGSLLDAEASGPARPPADYNFSANPYPETCPALDSYASGSAGRPPVSDGTAAPAHPTIVGDAYPEAEFALDANVSGPARPPANYDAAVYAYPEVSSEHPEVLKRKAVPSLTTGAAKRSRWDDDDD